MFFYDEKLNLAIHNLNLNITTRMREVPPAFKSQGAIFNATGLTVLIFSGNVPDFTKV